MTFIDITSKSMSETPHSNAPLPVVLPIHLRTENPLKEYGLWERATGAIKVFNPVRNLDFVRLLDASDKVVTDSGGV